MRDTVEDYYGIAEIAAACNVPRFIAKTSSEVPTWAVEEVAWLKGIYPTGDFRGTYIYDKRTAATIVNAVNDLTRDEWRKLIASTIDTFEMELQQ